MTFSSLKSTYLYREPESPNKHCRGNKTGYYYLKAIAMTGSSLIKVMQPLLYCCCFVLLQFLLQFCNLHVLCENMLQDDKPFIF